MSIRIRKKLSEHFAGHSPPDTRIRRLLVDAFLHENASFSYEVIHTLHPRVEVAVKNAVYHDEDGTLVHPTLLLTFPRASRLERILTFVTGIPRVISRYVRSMKPSTFDYAQAGLLPSTQEWVYVARRLTQETHHAPQDEETQIPYPSDPPLTFTKKTLLDDFTRDVHARIHGLREQIRDTLLQQALSLRKDLRQLEKENLEACIHELHAFYAERDQADAVHGHSHRVGMLLTALSPTIGIEKQGLRHYMLGLMHDLGKLLIPSDILKADRRLTDAEWYMIHLHPWLGSVMLETTSHDLFDMAGFLSLYHHENWDGTGYPYGIVWRDVYHAPEELPRLPPENYAVSSAIRLVSLLRIVDSLEAIFSKKYSLRQGERAYNIIVPLDADKLSSYIQEDISHHVGGWYDPTLITRIIPFIPRIQEAYERLRETRGLLIPPWIEDDPAYDRLLTVISDLDPFSRMV